MQFMASRLAALALVWVPALGCTVLTGADDLQECASRSCLSTAKDPTDPRDGVPEADGASASDESDEDDGAGDEVGTSRPSTAPRPPLICDGLTCDGATPDCCQHDDARGSCVAIDDDCTGARVSCTGADHCGDGTICCAVASADFADCLSAEDCLLIRGQIMCDADADCMAGESCSQFDPLFEHSLCQ